MYPVAQLLLGTARLVPTPSYLPLRLRCIRALQRLSSATGLLVPLAPLCCEMLQWGALNKPPKGGQGGRCPDLMLQLRVSKANLATMALQEEVVSQVSAVPAGLLTGKVTGSCCGGWVGGWWVCMSACTWTMWS